ncbi:MAG TPA: enoyl-CoA hydratase-related protein [Acidimicrobiia bacterium]|nr:enoyl-CoA hydratase-related protein [Acidimicrobiia bacterium]
MTYTGVAGLAVALGDDGALRIRLDRPEKRNAIDDVMVAAMIDAIDRAGRDEAVRVIVLTAAGEHFCSGFDIVARNAERSDVRPRVGSIQRRLPGQAHRLIPLMTTVQTPIVCGARGWIAGIGLHVVAACDFAVVADDARVWEPFSERGFTPDSGGTWLLPRLVGVNRARELLLLGRALTGAEAAEWGLVHRAVPPDQLDAAVEELVARLAAGATVALGLAKWLVQAGSAVPLEEQLRNEAFAMELSSRSEDFREGLAAFKEKRPPRFTGR